MGDNKDSKRRNFLIIMLEKFIESEGLYGFGDEGLKVCEDCRQVTEVSGVDDSVQHKDWCDYVFARDWLKEIKDS